MAKETAAQRRTRIGMLLADYDARSRELRKLAKDVDALKAQIREIEPGTYGDWIRGEGTPREVMDQQEAKRLLTAAGIPVPVKLTEAPITVTAK